MPSSLWDRIRLALSREKRDLEEVVADAAARGNDALDAKERELAATPEEGLRLAQKRAAEADAEFEALKRQIEEGR